MLETLFRYVRIIRWILADSVFRLKKKAFLIIASEMVGLLLQVGAVLVVIRYVQILESGTAISIGPHYFENQSELFVYVAIVILCCLIVSSILLLYSGQRIFKLQFEYDKLCSKRVFELYHHFIHDSTFTRKYNEKDVLVIAKKDSHYCGRAVRMLLTCFRPIVILIIAIPVMFFINFMVTFLLMAIALATVFFQYYVSKEAANNSLLIERCSPEASLEKTEMAKNSIKFPKISEGQFLEYIDSKFNNKSTAKFYNLYQNWMISVEKSSFINNILLAISIFLILIILFNDVIQRGTGWSELIIYILAARFSLANIRQLSKTITAVNRLYPQLLRYMGYVEDTCSKKMDKKEAIDLSSNLYSLFMQKGLVLPSFIAHLNLNSVYLTTDFPLKEAKYSEVFCLDKELGIEDYLKYVGETDLLDRFKTQVLKKIKINKDVNWDSIDTDLLFVMMLITFAHSKVELAIIDSDDVNKLSKETWSCLLDKVQGKKIVVKGKAIKEAGSYEEENIIILLSTCCKILSIDELNSSKEHIKELLNNPHSLESGKGSSVSSEIDEFN